MMHDYKIVEVVESVFKSAAEPHDEISMGLPVLPAPPSSDADDAERREYQHKLKIGSKTVWVTVTRHVAVDINFCPGIESDELRELAFEAVVAMDKVWKDGGP